MVSLFLGGGFAAAVVPILKDLPASKASQLFLKLSIIVILTFSGAAIILALVPGALLGLLMPGLSLEMQATATPFFVITALALPLTALNGVFQAKLMASERFLVSQAGTFIFNTTIITCVLIAGQRDLITSVTLGVLAGAAIRLIAQGFQIRTIWVPASKGYLPVAHKLFSSLAITTLFSATLALIPIIGRSYAFWVEPGGLSLFSYGYRISELPIVLLFASIAIVFLPRIANAFKNADHVSVVGEIAVVLKLALIVAVAMAIPVLFFAEEFVGFLFSSTQLTSAQIAQLKILLLIAIAFMPFRGCLLLALPILSATGNAKRLIVIAALALLTQLVMSTMATQYLGLSGAMLGYGCAHLVGMVFFLRALHSDISATIVKTVLRGLLYSGGLPLGSIAVLCWVGQRFVTGGLGALTYSAFAFVAFVVMLARLDANARLIATSIAARLV